MDIFRSPILEADEVRTTPEPLASESEPTTHSRRGIASYSRGKFSEATSRVVLPAVEVDVLVTALRGVISSGWDLSRRNSERTRLGPLLYMASPRPSESWPALARRVLNMLDRSFEQNLDETFGLRDEPLLSDDESSGLRILFGTHPEYHHVGVDVRRESAGDLLYPEQGPWVGRAASFYKTWEEGAAALALECLRASYGQETRGTDLRYESVRRGNSGIVGPNRLMREVVSTHVSRALVEPLEEVVTHFSRQRLHEGTDHIEFEAVSGVGPPDITNPSPWVWELRFPLDEPVQMGVQFSWSFRRRYFYQKDALPHDPDWIHINGNARWFTVTADVTFECEPPPRIWMINAHIDRVPGSYEASVSLRPDKTDRVFRIETSDTRPDYGYGIGWSWSSAKDERLLR